MQCDDAGLGLQRDHDGRRTAPSSTSAARESARRWRLPVASLAGLLALSGIASADAQPADSSSLEPAARIRADVAALEPASWPADPFAPRADGPTHHPRPPRHDPSADAIRRMVAAGNRIATLPYSWGGGHGSFTSSGYDCSGSVSYVLHSAGLLSTPEDSGGLMSYGEPGPGRLVTIYSNPEHAFLTIRGRRFDTIAFQETGTRWSSSVGSTDGYTVRHPRGM